MKTFGAKLLRSAQVGGLTLLFVARLAIYLPFGTLAAISAGAISALAVMILLQIPEARIQELATLAALAAAGCVLPAAIIGRGLMIACFHGFVASAITTGIALTLAAGVPAETADLGSIALVALLGGGIFGAAGPATACTSAEPAA